MGNRPLVGPFKHLQNLKMFGKALRFGTLVREFRKGGCQSIVSHAFCRRQAIGHKPHQSHISVLHGSCKDTVDLA